MSAPAIVIETPDHSPLTETEWPSEVLPDYETIRWVSSHKSEGAARAKAAKVGGTRIFHYKGHPWRAPAFYVGIPHDKK